MDKNSILEFGSKADVIISFYTDLKINGQEYKKGEPYLYLRDTNIGIRYFNEIKDGTKNKNITSWSDINPKEIVIGSIPFSRKITSLLAKLEEEVSIYNPRKFVTLTANRPDPEENGIIFLLEDLSEEKEFFVYDRDFNKIESTYDEGMNAVEGDFEDNEEYLISFSSEEGVTKFSLNKPALPYMSIEIQGKGNVDKQTKNIYMYFDKVSLKTEMEFTFIQDEIVNIPLVFSIVENKNNHLYIGE